ncbi:MAG: oligosaccharide flippase family protein [Anaerolineales bacterium]
MSYFKKVKQTTTNISNKFPIYARIARGGVWKIGGTALVSILSVLISALLARLLSPSDMGDYTYALSLVVMVSTVAGVGLGPTAIREVAVSLGLGDKDKTRDLLQQIIKWGFISLTVTILIFYLIRDNLGIQSGIVPLIIAWILLLSPQQLWIDLVRSFRNTQVASLFHGGRIGGPIAASVSAIILYIVWKTQGQIQLKTAILILLVGGGISLVLLAIILNRNIRLNIGGLKLSFDLPALALLGASLPVLFHSLGSSLQTQSSIWILKAFQPETDIALMGVAFQLASFLMIQQNIVIFVLSPEIAALFSEGKIIKLEKLQRRIAAVAFLPTLIGFLIYLFWGSEILRILYGPFYISAKPILMIITVGYLFHVFAGACGLILTMSGNQLELMKISLICSVITAGAGLLLVQSFGVLGVATAASLGYIVKNIWMLLRVRKLVGIWTFASLKWK